MQWNAEWIMWSALLVLIIEIPFPTPLRWHNRQTQKNSKAVVPYLPEPHKSGSGFFVSFWLIKPPALPVST
jgi:hypothetical protein